MNVFGWLPARVAPIEVVWFLTGFLPLLRDLRFLWGLRRDQLTLRRDGKNGADDITIMTHIGHNWFVATGHGIIVAMGAIAMALPPSGPRPSPDSGPSVLGLVVTGALFLLSLTFTGMTFWNSGRWALIVRYMKAQPVDQRTIAALIDKVGALEMALAENTVISAHAADRADQAFHEANSVNLKIAAVSERGEATLNEVRRAADAHESRDEAREGRDVGRADQATEDLAHNTELTEAAKDAAETILAEQQKRRR